jgi:hypothetical protein
VPFSNFWPSSAVLDNGYVLVTLAIILSVMRGEHIDIVEARDEIIEKVAGPIKEGSKEQNGSGLPAKDELVPGLTDGSEDETHFGFPTDALVGLQQGLRGIRSKIQNGCIDGQFRISGARALRDEVKYWMDAGLKGDELRSVIFKLDPKIQIIYSSHSVDSISLLSLFGDILNFSLPYDANQFVPIERVLARWAGIKGAISLNIDDVYRTAKRLLVQFLRPGEEGEDYPPPLDKRIPRSYVGDERYLLIRATMLLAFTRAWYVVTVQRRCGFQNVMERAYWFLGMDQLSPSNRSYRLKQLLGDRRKVYRGTSAYRAPFNKRYTKPHEAYSLERNVPSVLDDFERNLCFRFIHSGDVYDFNMGPLGRKKEPWEPLKHPYPRWLTEQDD